MSEASEAAIAVLAEVIGVETEAVSEVLPQGLVETVADSVVHLPEVTEVAAIPTAPDTKNSNAVAKNTNDVDGRAKAAMIEAEMTTDAVRMIAVVMTIGAERMTEVATMTVGIHEAEPVSRCGQRNA